MGNDPGQTEIPEPTRPPTVEIAPEEVALHIQLEDDDA